MLITYNKHNPQIWVFPLQLPHSVLQQSSLYFNTLNCTVLQGTTLHYTRLHCSAAFEQLPGCSEGYESNKAMGRKGGWGILS